MTDLIVLALLLRARGAGAMTNITTLTLLLRTGGAQVSASPITLALLVYILQPAESILVRNSILYSLLYVRPKLVVGNKSRHPKPAINFESMIEEL